VVLVKTINEIGREYNVTVQAVYKRIKKFKTSLIPHLTKDENGRTVIDNEGERILTESWGKSLNQSVKPSLNQSDPNDHQFKDFLQEQIKVKDDTIRDLLEQNKQLVKEVEYFQILLKNAQELQLLPSSSEAPESEAPADETADQMKAKTKKTFFQRLFRK
jgi:hypothetical protein